jgi:hypothetical protein
MSRNGHANKRGVASDGMKEKPKETFWKMLKFDSA